jgi:hypothetical protein
MRYRPEARRAGVARCSQPNEPGLRRDVCAGKHAGDDTAIGSILCSARPVLSFITYQEFRGGLCMAAARKALFSRSCRVAKLASQMRTAFLSKA